MKTTLSLLLAGGLFLLNSCCSKSTCPVETDVSEITFHNFSAGELDTVQVVAYSKEDTAFTIPTDSFFVLPERRPVGEEIVVTTPKPINLEHNYLVRLRQNTQAYKITELQLTARECAVGCMQPGVNNYKGFGQYLLNGTLQQTDRLRIYRWHNSAGKQRIYLKISNTIQAPTQAITPM